MRERLALVGGTLEVESSRESGTTIAAQVPAPASLTETAADGPGGRPDLVRAVTLSRLAIRRTISLGQLEPEYGKPTDPHRQGHDRSRSRRSTRAGNERACRRERSSRRSSTHAQLACVQLGADRPQDRESPRHGRRLERRSRAAIREAAALGLRVSTDPAPERSRYGHERGAGRPCADRRRPRRRPHGDPSAARPGGRDRTCRRGQLGPRGDLRSPQPQAGRDPHGCRDAGRQRSRRDPDAPEGASGDEGAGALDAGRPALRPRGVRRRRDAATC